jgi:hypothetical protein
MTTPPTPVPIGPMAAWAPINAGVASFAANFAAGGYHVVHADISPDGSDSPATLFLVPAGAIAASTKFSIVDSDALISVNPGPHTLLVTTSNPGANAARPANLVGLSIAPANPAVVAAHSLAIEAHAGPVPGGDEWAAGIFRRRPRPDPEIEDGPDGPTAAYARSITPEVRAALRDALPPLLNLIPVVGPILSLIVRLVVEASAARRAKADPLERAAMAADRSTYHPAMAAALDGRLPIGPEES